MDDEASPPDPAAIGDGAARFEVFVVHEHPVVRIGLAALLRGCDGLALLGACSPGEPDGLASAAKADVVVVGLTRGAGVPLVRELAARHPGLSLLALSGHAGDELVAPLLAAGARGCVSASEPPERLLDAIRRVAAGSLAVTGRAPPLRSRRLEGRRGFGLLSDREMEVCERLARGLATAEIAGAMGVSVKTVEKHRERIKRKLGLRSANELLVKAVELRLACE